MSVALATHVGELALANPVMTASGTAGHGAELAPYGDLGSLGAVVVKSLCVEPWAGNPAPRLTEVGPAMLNSVGLSGPGIAAWLEQDLPALRAAGATVVASIWGRRVADFADAASALAPEAAALAARRGERELPEHRGPGAHVRPLAERHRGGRRGGRVRVAPLGEAQSQRGGPDGDRRRRPGAGAASPHARQHRASGMAIDTEARRPVLGAGGGGLSGPPLRAIAVRSVFECRAAFPDLPLIGVGGVSSGADAVELLLAGANAVQVGTATFRDPRAPWRVLRELAALVRGSRCGRPRRTDRSCA